MPITELPTSTPSAQGVSAKAVVALLDALEAASEVDPHSLMVVRHGHVVAAGWWAPYTAQRVQLLYSLSKSFTATAAALAAGEGLLRLDDTVLSHFPEFDADITDPRSRSMLIRHVAAMASGHVAETWERAMSADPVEPVRGFLLTPPERDPGTVFAYNQPCTYSLGAIVARESGQTLTQYLRQRLLDRIGVGGVGWKQYPPGRDMGFSGLHATTDAIARLGLLYLQRGRWDGEAVLPPEWIEQATRAQVANPDDASADWRQGYGFQFWMSRHGYRGDGAYGQFCLVLPEQDTVVAMTMATEAGPMVLDAVWEHLLPGLGPDSRDPDPAADAALAQRMSGLSLPAFRADRQPRSADRAGWTDAWFTPAAAGSEPRSLTRVGLCGDGDGDGDGWRLVLAESDGELVARLGTDGWAVTEPGGLGTEPDGLGNEGPHISVPVAVSGGWTDSGALHAELLFLETPHRLRVDCDLASGTFRASWATAPLHAASLRELAAPRPLG